MLKVVARLASNRVKPGVLTVVEDGVTVLGPFPCLGKADNAAAAKEGNPGRDPLRRMGDTPTGEWLITRVIPAGPGMPADKYGPYGALDLKPFAGPCVQAYLNGRSGIWIHSGKPSASGGLRPTHGCIRLSDVDMKKLIARLSTTLKTERVRLVVTDSD